MMNTSCHYTLNGVSLEIICSDSQQEHVEEHRIPCAHGVHRDGRKREHRRLFRDSDISKDWRKKIGTELAIKFLLKPSDCPYMIILSSQPLLTPSLVDYSLAKFPKGYILISDILSADAMSVNHVIGRYDVYLYSMGSLLSLSYLLPTYPFPKVITTSSVLQRNLCLTLPGSLLVCHQGVVNANIAAQAKSLRKISTKSCVMASGKQWITSTISGIKQKRIDCATHRVIFLWKRCSSSLFLFLGEY